MPAFSLDDQPEVFRTSTATSRAIARLMRAGEVRPLGHRLYTRNTTEDLAQVARRNWSRVTGMLFPGAVVTDRTALELEPAEDGSITLVATTKNEIRLPGLRLRPRLGAGPLADDHRWMGEPVHMSSRPRAFLENMRPSRARRGLPRTLTTAQMEAQLERYARHDPAALNDLRDQARTLVDSLDAHAAFERLDELIGRLHGTREGRLASSAARARAAGRPYDAQRLVRFEQLQQHLIQVRPPTLAADPRHELTTFAFFEAYFSNFIEGTEFTVEEAQRIVFEGHVPSQRPKDAHDILGTYRIVAEPRRRDRIPSSADDLVTLLREQHELMLHERPEVGPGEFKAEPNRAGGTQFVAPALVEGTLREGHRYYETLPAGFARAVFAMFLVSEVHPFADGNGRVARVLMNAELSSAGQQRIVITTAARGDYLYALRGMTHNANAASLVRVLAVRQQETAELDFSSRAAAELELHRRGAFSDPADGVGIDPGLLGTA